MSSFTQFTGSAVPFGQLIPLWDYRDNPTIQGIEYLRAGVLKSITGYSSLVADWPSLAVNTNTGGVYSSGTSTGASAHFLTDGTRYYGFGPTTTVYSTSLTSNWTTGVGGGPAGAQIDAFRFGSAGTTLVFITATNAAYIVGTAATPIAPTVSQIAGAANTAGTLGVICAAVAATAGNIYTSTNGTAWTSRTPSGATGAGSIRSATWSPVSSRFIYLDSNGNIHTTTDGFTLTFRANVSPAPSSFTYMPTALCASSATSTLIGYNTNTEGSYIVRTTDGVSYPKTAITTLLNSSIYQITGLQYFGGAYYAFGGIGTATTLPNIYKSTDDGVTWSPVPQIVGNPFSSANNIASVMSLNGNIIVNMRNSSSGNKYFVLGSTDTANYIGVAPPTETLAGTGAGNYAFSFSYLRIK